MNGIIWSFRYATRRPPAPGADRWSLAEPCRDLLRSAAHRFRQLHALRPCTGRAQVAPNGDSKDSMKSWFQDPRSPLPASSFPCRNSIPPFESRGHLRMQSRADRPMCRSEAPAQTCRPEPQVHQCASASALQNSAPTLFLVESAPVRLLQPRIITEKQLYLRDPLRILLTV